MVENIENLIYRLFLGGLDRMDGELDADTHRISSFLNRRVNCNSHISLQCPARVSYMQRAELGDQHRTLDRREFYRQFEPLSG